MEVQVHTSFLCDGNEAGVLTYLFPPVPLLANGVPFTTRLGSFLGLAARSLSLLFSFCSSRGVVSSCKAARSLVVILIRNLCCFVNIAIRGPGVGVIGSRNVVVEDVGLGSLLDARPFVAVEVTFVEEGAIEDLRCG